MRNDPKLTAQEQQFFELVARAIFVNPFSDERAEVDALIVGDASASAADPTERTLLFAPRVSQQIEGLKARGLGTIQAFSGQDRELVEHAHLFDLFHQHIGDFDALIQTQLTQAETPASVPFARRALVALAERGFAPKDAVRYFALFYQLRRAFYFIEHGLVGRSPCMKSLRRALWDNVFTRDIRLYDRHLWDRMEDFSTLLLGETGTGKGTAAGAIGRSGYIPFNESTGKFAESFTKSFVSINLSQYPETLIESELFGHRKGAFTGAVDDHKGIFSRCSRYGSLFLDEIGEVSTPVQIKLLQVLEERTFSPVGSHEKLRFEGRVIAATNQSVRALRKSGRFRDDFYYRLCSDTIALPSLRQRIAEDRAELDDLIAATARRMLDKAPADLIGSIREAIERGLPAGYPWPGNVRELEQAVRRILLTGTYEGDVEPQASDALSALVRGIEAGALDASELLSRYCAMLYAQHGTYEEVARRTGLDRRTVKKHVDAAPRRPDA